MITRPQPSLFGHRFGALSMFVLATIGLTGCGSSRPYYTGPGSMAATLPYQPRPTWLAQDTAATYVSVYGGPAFRYNEFDDNMAFGGQISRGWARRNMCASAGIFGGGGRYTYAKSYAPERLARLSYGVAGVQVGGGIFPVTEFAVRTTSGVEWRVLNVHVSLAREWGALADWRARPVDRQGQPLIFTKNISTSPWRATASFGTELVTRSPRPLAPNVAFGFGYQVRQGDGSMYATLAAGAGPVLVSGQIIGPGELAVSKPVYQFGLTYVISKP